MCCSGKSFPDAPILLDRLLLSRQARSPRRAGTDGISQSTFVGGSGTLVELTGVRLGRFGEIGFAMPDAASSLV